MAKSVRDSNEKSKNKNGQNAAKFENYWTDEDVSTGLENGSLIEVNEITLSWKLWYMQ